MANKVEFVPQAPLVARLILRVKLRQYALTTDDAPTLQAINSALADPKLLDQAVMSSIDEAGMTLPAGGIFPAGLLQQLLTFLISNLPQIIAVIMALLNISPSPTPVPAMPATSVV